MKKSTLYYIWAVLYALCALLSLISTPSAPLKAVMVVLGIAFFVPPVLLRLQKEEKTRRQLLIISTVSLAATFVLLLANIFAAVAATETLGILLHYVLVFVSVPMSCFGSYALSLFLWACLLFSCLKGRK